MRALAVVTQLERAGAQTLASMLETLLSPEVRTETCFLYNKSGSDLFDEDQALLPRRTRNPVTLLGMARELRRRMERSAVVVAHTHFSIALCAIISRSVRHPPRLIAVHHWPVDRYPAPARWAIAAGRRFNWFYSEVFVSDSIVDIPAGKVIPNPVPSVDLDEVRQDLLPDVDLLIVARHAREKGIDLAICALARLPGRSLTLIGGGPLTGDLEQLADSLGVRDRVRFAGHVAATTVRQYMASARILVLPSRWEAMPMVLLEGVAIGTPMVVSRISAHDFLLRVGAAEGFDYEDVADLSRAIESIDLNRIRLSAGVELVRSSQSLAEVRELWLRALDPSSFDDSPPAIGEFADRNEVNT